MKNNEQPQKPEPTKMATGSDYATAAPNKDSAAALHTEIKKTWNKLSDEDIKLHDKQPEQFYAKVKEKHNVPTQDAEKSLKAMKTSCGCGTNKAA